MPGHSIKDEVASAGRANPGEQPSAGSSNNGALSERRRSPRYAFTAAAEAIERRSGTRGSGRCADLSLGGCYVDTISPFAVDTDVILRLKRGELSFESPARVVYSKVGMGMGLAFYDTTLQERTTLEQWFACLAGDIPLLDKPHEEAREPEKPLQNERHVLNQLISSLIRKRVLTESEGAQLIRELFR